MSTPTIQYRGQLVEDLAVIASRRQMNGMNRLRNHWEFMQGKTPENSGIEGHATKVLAGAYTVLGTISGAALSKFTCLLLEPLKAFNKDLVEKTQMFVQATFPLGGAAIGALQYMVRIEGSTPFNTYQHDMLTDLITQKCFEKFEDDKVLNGLVCPVSAELLTEPVLTPSNTGYQKSSVLKLKRTVGGLIEDPLRNPAFADTQLRVWAECGLIVNMRLHELTLEIAGAVDDILTGDHPCHHEIKMSLKAKIGGYDKAAGQYFSIAKKQIESLKEVLEPAEFEKQKAEFLALFGRSAPMKWEQDWMSVLQKRLLEIHVVYGTIE
jgi:hypothetical protein